MRILPFIAAFALALVAGLSSAQTVPGTLNLSWTLPTVGCTTGVSPCDNVPLTGPTALTGIEVYIDTAPISDTYSGAAKVTLSATATTTTYNQSVTNGQTLYVRLKAVNANGKSVFSNQVSKLISLPVLPGTPTNVLITITITP